MTIAVSPAERARALWMLVAATFFWGLSFPVIKTLLLLQEQLVPEAGGWFSAIYVLAPRFLIASLVIIAWRPRGFWRITGAEWKQGVIIGLFSSAGMLLQNDALQFTAASTSAFLTQFYVILIPVWLTFRHGMVPGGRVWVCCALVLAGVAVLGRFDWQELRLGRGEWETLLCSVFFTGQILWLGKGEFAGNRTEKVTLVMFVTQAAIFAVAAVAVAPSVAVLVKPWLSA
ncbi:MAG: DMT family transporter, partial [Verrucomicrobiota bacterium]